MTQTRRPVVFIHGLWLHASSWQPWVDLFDRRGLRAASPPAGPAIPDTVDARRAHPDAIADNGIDDVVDHYHRHHRRACPRRRSWSATPSAA